jgi:UDP-glucose 4-epimerase
MAVLVTGGAGFIGSNLVDELLTQKFEVTVLDNLSEGKLENLQRWKGGKRFEFVRADVRDFETVRRACDHKDWVFHLAAMSRIQPSITDPLLAWQQNIVGTANVLEAARQCGVKRVVYSASSSAYGLRNTLPNREDMPTDCLNPYSLSKKVGEELCKLYHDLYGLSTVSLRYFNVYGPRHQEEGQYATVIAIFRKQKRLGQPLTIVGDGEQRRDFTFVGDVVRANMMAAMNRDVNGIVNIGSGENHSINGVANMIIGQHGFSEPEDVVHIPPRPAEARETLADVSRARGELGWSPSVDLGKGLAILDLYEKNNSPSIVLG